MKTLLLAAGRSLRLNPLRDKNFLSFNGKPLIVHQLEKLKNVGIDEVILVGGKHNLKELEDLTCPMKKTVVEQIDLEAGMKGAVLACKKLIKNESILIISGNDIIDENGYKNVIEVSKKTDLDGALLAKKVGSYFPGGYINTAGEKIISIMEKPGIGNEPSDMVNLVVHYHKNANALLEKLEDISSENDDLYELALDQLFKELHFKAVSYDNFWLTIKYPWHIFEVMNYFLGGIESQNIHESVFVAETAVIKGNVIIEEGTKIFDHATINGPCYIGKNCIIANNALVRGSIMGDKSVAGYATEIARSYLGSDVWTHTNYVGDSIIDNNVSFGAGTVTGNLRLDEKEIAMNIKGEKIVSPINKLGSIIGNGVRVGINTSIMPGIKIGKHSFVGGGLVIDRDIPDHSFVKGENKLVITENKLKEVKMERDEFKG